MEPFLKIYLIVCTIACFLFLFVFRSFHAYRLTGQMPFAMPETENAEAYILRSFIVMGLLVAISVLFYIVSPQLYEWLVPIRYLDNENFHLYGVVILTFSFFIIFFAQHQMKESWRIGIQHDVNTKLVIRGLFSYSRNPIYLGVLTGLAGLFLIIPNALTLLVLISMLILLQIQVRLEEKYLEKIQGSLYSKYKEKVRRWF